MTFNNDAALHLADLEIGERARLGAPSELTPVVLRLLEMGMTEGAEVVLTRRAPLGDPLELRLRGTRLSLRKHEATLFPVERIEAERPRDRAAHVALIGNPNSGKTTLFNQLTGLSARVGNYPGITVEHLEGTLETAGGEVSLVNLPGTYSMVPRADDEAVAVRGVLGLIEGAPPPNLAVCVIDVTHLERNLYLVAQLRELGLPLLVVLTMMDTLHHDGFTIDIEALATRVGVPVVPGVDAAEAINEMLGERAPSRAPPLPVPGLDALPDDDRVALEDIGAHLSRFVHGAPASALGAWAVGAEATQTLPGLGLDDSAIRKVRALDHTQTLARTFTSARYAEVQRWADGVIQKRSDVLHLGRTEGGHESPSETLTTRVDRVVLHRVWGPILLVTIFAALFQALFAWANPFMDFIEGAVGTVGTAVATVLPDSLPLLRSLWMDGLVAGVGNVLVFIPQIAILFLVLGLLEDSGYLARAAFILDRLMARVGLHGRAFVPMLSGFACAIPAIMSTRTIENEKDRLVTILVTPLVSCSARLPIYALMIATVFSTMPKVLGIVHPGTIVMISMYALSIVAAVGMAAIFKRTLLRSPTPPLVLELPPYRTPKVGAVLRHVGSRVKLFIVEAGTVILAVTVVLWGLFNFPRDDTMEKKADATVAQIEKSTLDGDKKAALVRKVEAERGQDRVRYSIAGRVGYGLQPVIAPLGYDWKIGVGLLASFAAREVLVSSLGLVYGLGDGTDEETVSLRESMRKDVNPRTGGKLYTPLTGLSLMVFFVLAMQCMSTLAVVRRETRSWRWPIFQVAYMTALAYVGALLVYQGGLALGFS